MRRRFDTNFVLHDFRDALVSCQDRELACLGDGVAVASRLPPKAQSPALLPRRSPLLQALSQAFPQAFPEAFLVSTGVVALGEIGDKTQLLALMLAARWRRPWTIVCGILVATLLNHALAGAVGAAVAAWLAPQWLRWIVGLSFLGMAAWMLVPDEAGELDGGAGRLGVFGTTALCFFLAEMGDKTQIATVALAARYAELAAVVAGSTLGLMLANVPVVFLGEKASRRLPLRLVHASAAAVFVVLGLLTLLGWPGLS